MSKKSFSDLVWKDNQAELRFRNGYIARVIKGGSGTTIGSPFIFKCIPMNSVISDDEIGYCNEEDITQLLHEVQQLPKLKD